jgi:hypothetical protein
MTKRFRIARLLALLCVAGAFSFAIVGCGSSSSSSSGTASGTTTSISHTKTKFVLHAGLAFGAFHRWIYKPLKAGDFAHPLSHKLTIVKGALAAGFVVHELKLALTDAQADPTLSKFTAPITELQNKLSGAGSAIRSGNIDASQFDSANSLISSVRSQAAAAGQSITEQTPAAP